MTLVLLPLRLVLGLTKVSVVAGYRVGRLAGYRRLTVLAIGVAIGLLVAPVPGRELRERLRRRWEESTGLVPAPDAPVPAPTSAPGARPGAPPPAAPGTGGE